MFKIKAGVMKDTRDRILKTSEKLIFNKGMEDVSLRTIAAKAKVNVAAINYHFGSKDQLIVEIFSKFIASFEDIRDNLLLKTQERNGNNSHSVTDLVKGYLMPWVMFKKSHPQSLNNLFRFYASRNEKSRTLFRNAIQEMARSGYAQFSEKIYKALPGIKRDILKKRINIAAAAAATYVINEWFIERLEELSGLKINHEILINQIVGMIERGSVD